MTEVSDDIQLLKTALSQPTAELNLSLCCEYCLDVAWRLRRASCHSLALLLQECEYSLQVLAEADTLDEQALQAIRQVADYLPEGLARWQQGLLDNPVYLTPFFDDLRAIQDAPYFCEQTLFFPRLPWQLTLAPVSASAEQAFAQGIAGILQHKHRHLAWARVAHAIEEILQAQTTDTQHLWRVLQAFVRLFAENRLSFSYAHQRMLRSALDLLVLLQAKEDFQAQELIAYPLMQQMLYYLSIAPGTSTQEYALWQQYQLGRAVFHLEPGERAYVRDGHNMALWQQLRQQLAVEAEQLKQSTPADIELGRKIIDGLVSLQQYVLASDLEQALTTEDDNTAWAIADELLLTPEKVPAVLLEQSDDSEVCFFIEALYDALGDMLNSLAEWQELQNVKTIESVANVMMNLKQQADLLKFDELAGLFDALEQSCRAALLQQSCHQEMQPLLTLLESIANTMPDLADSISHATTPEADVSALVGQAKLCQQQLLQLDGAELAPAWAETVAVPASEELLPLVQQMQNLLQQPEPGNVAVWQALQANNAKILALLQSEEQSQLEESFIN